ncbi:Uricase [Psilocybe cubensis]|uniref:Uricase n=2 Tax=Psilocybe cubensis TaxID=181762 RepID=A0A8H7XN44_PSICU|nr:Uricase [Psilocybe cubensis]KAH9481928.1 Uricase [Psilocybe cubensis]
MSVSSSTSNLGELSAARYGKTKVRVFRIVREGKWHHIVEYNVQALLEGEIAVSYSEADNSVVVATDSIKNITYYLAKISPHILNAEKFALHLATFFVSKYAHISKAFVEIEQLRWTRIHVAGEESPEGHPHSFFRDGDDKRIVKVEVDGSAGKDKLVGKVTAGINDLLVLKSTGSAFENFYRDEYTTLVEVNDRIFSTSVDLSYTFTNIPIAAPTDEKKLDFVIPVQKGETGYAGSVWDEDVPARARAATLETFAVDESASVQATLYKMAQRIVAENDSVHSVTYTLPNKHYIPVDMRYLDVDNLTPSKAEVFVPIAAPSGLISATITRK